MGSLERVFNFITGMEKSLAFLKYFIRKFEKLLIIRK
jgi:hypothetical protein